MTVADNFRQAALDNEDFGSIGERVVSALLSGYGKFADAIFFLQLGFAGLKVKMLEMAKVVVDRIDPIFTFIMDKYNKMAAVFGMDLVDTGKMSAMSAGLKESIGAAIDNVSAMMSQPLPSEGIQATFDESLRQVEGWLKKLLIIHLQKLCLMM